MSDCGGYDTGGAADSWCGADTSNNYSSSYDPPPDYSTYISHRETDNSNHSSTHHHPVPQDTVTAAPLTDHILHDIAPSAPFHHVTTESGNLYDQRVYYPSYLADRPSNWRPSLSELKRIALGTTDAQNSSRRRKISTALYIGLVLLICSIVPIVIVIYIYGIPVKLSSNKAVDNSCVYEPCDSEYDD